LNRTLFRFSCVVAAAAAALCGPVVAEDIDLFVTPSGSGQNPNIVIMIDNSANWDSNSQHWVGIAGGGLVKQGQSELRAIYRVLDEVDDKVNLGLMLFTPGPGTTPNGAYVRFHVRTMNGTNKAAFKELIGTGTCVNGNNSLNGTPNCMFNNFSTPNEKVGTAKLDYSAGLFEVFKYFGGFTYPAMAHVDPPVAGAPTDATHFGTVRYARNGDPGDPSSDAAAYYGGAARTGYNPPLNADGSNSCAKNYLVFIGNGFPSQDMPCSILQGVNGIANCSPGPQLSMPQFTMVTNNITSTLGTDAVCRTAAACATAAATTFPGYDTYACTGGVASPDTTLGTDAVCESAAACATRAQTTFPGHTTYFCTGGTTPAPQTGTDKACETVAACSARAALVFPGHTSYSCTGGSTTGGSVNLGTDTATESQPACLVRAQNTFPGYNAYSCTGGSAAGTTTTPLGSSGAVCETVAACQARMQTLHPGHTSYTCAAGTNIATSPTLDTSCDKPSGGGSCATGPAPAAIPTAASWTCSGGAVCGIGRFVNMTMQGTCAVGKLAHYTVTASDNNLVNQTMTGTGCTVAGRLTGQTMATQDCTSNQTMKASDACISNQTITGTKAVNTVTPTNTAAPPANNVARFTDEWARYLFTTDVNGVAGFQNVQTYSIDVFKDQQDPNETALLMSMAKYGGGRYFQATDEQSIINALKEILIEIQSVNSVFASASLPISAANRSQNENQVFIGMFRPDSVANPRWYGNIKRYQIALFGADAKLADRDGKEALAATTGFIQACATSYYTTDSNVVGATYWDFSPSSAGTCTSVANSTFNDLPDGGVVEKGSGAEVLRKGNDPTAVAPFVVNRTMKTCATAPCVGLVDFTAGNVPQARTGAATPAQHTAIIDFSYGKDALDENGNANFTEPRASIHGDITHSRPLPVNFGGSRGVEVFYGSNDGAFHALSGNTGKEIWSFIAPEHHAKLKRLYDNSPKIIYPPPTANLAGSLRKDYFFDGSAGLYETFHPDNTADKVWIFPSMRRGGRAIYAFDVSSTGAPVFKWNIGCPNLTDDTNCTAGTAGIGQTWSVPSVAFIKGYNSGNDPVVIFGGGYDNCEDTDNATTTCTPVNKGNHVYVFNADTGAFLKSFDTDRAVPADVTLIDRDFDGKVDHAYVSDTGGSIYRIDFVDPANQAPRAAGLWTITKIAQTQGGSRKFMFPVAALSVTDRVYLAVGSGDRERPLISNYPYTTPVLNRYYMFMDLFPVGGTPIDLDGSTLDDFTAATTCNTTMGNGQNGWRLDLNTGTGEQTVTGSVIFGGTIFFSTNRPTPTAANSCATNLGEARGYAINLLNASGVIGSGALCGGNRSDTFVGGGIPPSPVSGTVQVQTPSGPKTIPILIGAANIGGDGPSFSIGGQQPPVPIKRIRQRIYWYRHGDK